MPTTAKKIVTPDRTVVVPGETTYQLTLTPTAAYTLWALLGSFSAVDLAEHQARRRSPHIDHIPIGGPDDGDATLRGICTVVYSALRDAGAGDEVK